MGKAKDTSEKRVTLSDQFDELDILIEAANEKHGEWVDAQAKADDLAKEYKAAALTAQNAQRALQDKLNNVFPQPEAPIPSDAGRVSRG